MRERKRKRRKCWRREMERQGGEIGEVDRMLRERKKGRGREKKGRGVVEWERVKGG